MVCCPINKGVGNLPSDQPQARAAGARWLHALSVVDDPTPADQHVTQLTESKAPSYYFRPSF